MSRYSAVWIEVAKQQYSECPPEVRRQVDATVEALLQDPEARGSYDKRTDQWTTTFGAGAGLIVYAIAEQQVKIIVLRLV